MSLICLIGLLTVAPRKLGSPDGGAELLLLTFELARSLRSYRHLLRMEREV